MNRARISLLVAAAVVVGVPALASAQDNQDHRENHGGDRGGRGAPPPVQDRRSQPAPQQQMPAPRQEAPRQAPPPPQQQQVPQQRPAGQGYGYHRMPDGQPGRGGQGQQQFQQQQQQPPIQQGRPQGYQDRRFNNGGDRPDNRGGYDGRRDDPRNDGRNEGRGDYRGGDHRGAPPPPNGYRGNDGRYGGGQGWQGGQPGRDYGRPGPNRPAWRNDWRGDNRYDWRGWRDRNRQQFHAPRYVAPRGYGWGYRSFGIGYRLDSFFFAPNYWINDPWDYRLPPVYGPYRWVRYYNDVLLVDIDTGEVVDVIQNFFW
ncbi:RcnB family protein [Sphingomonas sp. MMS24-J13]|uniref:RcnB family protein n=1 Tax=Sphingomonas sp. MMS24-J13 TaxID=3238686 RepID=UPI00384EA65C